MPLSDNIRGAVLMTASMICFVLNDAFLKMVSGQMPLSQMLFMRGTITTSILLALVWALGGVRVRVLSRDWWLILLRSGSEVAAAFFFLTGLFNMPLANASAILQALPLAVTLAGALFFGERVGYRRWLAITIGFVGVMLIIRPGADGFTIYSLSVLASVVAVTVRDLAARHISAQVPSVVVATAGSAAITLAGAVGLVGTGWTPVTATSLGQVGGAALLITGGYMFSVMTMRTADVAFTAPFRYTSLVASLLLGFIFFDEWPQLLTLVGAGIVVGTGLFTLYRETRVKSG